MEALEADGKEATPRPIEFYYPRSSDMDGPLGSGRARLGTRRALFWRQLPQ